MYLRRRRSEVGEVTEQEHSLQVEQEPCSTPAKAQSGGHGKCVLHAFVRYLPHIMCVGVKATS